VAQIPTFRDRYLVMTMKPIFRYMFTKDSFDASLSSVLSHVSLERREPEYQKARATSAVCRGGGA
jgi:hypothetical protein